jgi:hypothetical protein
MDNVLHSLKTIGMDMGKTAASVFAVHLTVGPTIVNLAGQQHEIIMFGAEGTCNAIASDIVDYFVQGRSKLLNGDILPLLDDAAFMGVVSGVCSKSGVSDQVLNLIGTVNLPIDPKYQGLLVQAGVISGARELSNVLERTEIGQNQFVRYARHPISSIAGR